MKRMLIVLSSAVMLAWCDDPPNRPVVPTAPSTPTTVAESAVSLEITGNTALTAVNETSQLTAIARFSDGSTRDVTRETRWRAFNTTIVTVSPMGLLTAVSPGRTGVDGQFQTRYGRREVSVIPAGTFVLSGTVIEPGSLPLFRAQVMIVDGPHAGRSTATDFNGAYELFGLTGDLGVTVIKDEYVVETKRVSLVEDRVLNFELKPMVAPVSIAGTYRLTFTPDASCASRLTDAAGPRSYRAVINQDAARVVVELFDAQFALNPRDGRGNKFTGRLQSNALSFSLGDPYYGYFEDLVEQIGPTTYLTINGHANAGATSSEIAGTLQGVIARWEAPDGFYGLGRRTSVDCRGSHQFVFTRQ